MCAPLHTSTACGAGNVPSPHLFAIIQFIASKAVARGSFRHPFVGQRALARVARLPTRKAHGLFLPGEANGSLDLSSDSFTAAFVPHHRELDL